MKGKKQIAQILVVTMLAYQIPAWGALAELTAEYEAGTEDGYRTATPGDLREDGSLATPSESTGKDQEEEDEKAGDPADVITAGAKATASNTSLFGVARDYGTEGTYMLEAEDTSLASCDNAWVHGDGNRVELQQYGSVTYDLSKIPDFQPGKYLVSVHMNGSSTAIDLKVNGDTKGTIEKGGIGFDFADCCEYAYRGVLELTGTEQLTIAEGNNGYAHLDWTKLVCVDTYYWLEAEDRSITTYVEDTGSDGKPVTGVHSDGDRVEVQGGGSITFELFQVPGFQPGVYDLYAGVNGDRTQWGFKVNGEDLGPVSAPGGGKWEKGTCVDIHLGEEIELSATGTIQLYDVSSSWGHVDYIRLVRTGDLVPGPVEEGYCQLEAENPSIASYENANLNSADRDRMELQSYGSVTYDLGKVDGFKDGSYLVSARMNGNSQTIQVSVNGQQKGTITKESPDGNWWESSYLKEYYYHGILELTGSDRLTIAEGQGQYAHLDWVKLVPVGVCFWIEAEDTSVASYAGAAKVHDEGDRVEVDGGGSITFDLAEYPGFRSGIYKLSAGVNGERTQWSVSADGQGRGSITAPGGGKYQTGTCMDVSFGTELELSAGSTIRLADLDGSWGHVDYIRLERTGDAAPRFDETDPETGIRVTAPQGVFQDGTTIQSYTVPRTARQTIRQQFKEEGQKVYFYRFRMKSPGLRSRSSKAGEDDGEAADALGGETVAYLPIPEGYSENCELYYLQEPEDLPEPVTGYWQDGRKLCFYMESLDGIYLLADQDIWKFEGENYYHKTTDGGQAADLQPSEDIVFSIPDDEAFESGLYNLLLRVCGGQSYTILVDGQEKASLSRPGTGWGEYEICVPGEALKLAPGQTVTLRADDNYGWVDYICLKEARDFEEEMEGVLVEAEAGAVPAGAELFVEPADDRLNLEIRELFGFADEGAPAMSFYRILLLMNGEEIRPSGSMRIRIPVPESFREAVRARMSKRSSDGGNLSLYHIQEGGKKTRISFELSEDGEYVVFQTEEPGIYGLVNQAMGSELYYQGVDYYDRTTGDNGQYADLQPGESLTLPVKDQPGFAQGNYILSVWTCGPRTKLMVLVNGRVVGMINRESTDWGQMDLAELPLVLSLTQDDEITLYAPGQENQGGPYGWVDYVQLKETDRVPEIPAPESRITLEAEDYYVYELEQNGTVANVNSPYRKLEIPILASEGFEENDYHFTMYTTGTMRRWIVCVNGVQVLEGERAGSGYEMKYMTKEIGSERIHLKPGDILTVEFPEQDTDNYGNWVDRIVLNSRRQVTGADFLNRVGGRIPVALAGDFESGGQPHVSMEDGKLVYQGEAYYKAQNDSPTADLQPGEQILIPVSDNGRFREGTYRVTVRSCGNREFFRVKVNGWTAGNITRKETGYGMNEMTEDTLGTPIELRPGDILAIEGQTGGKYGWVDDVSLTQVQTADGNAGDRSWYTWEGEDFYTKQKDNPAADLQPGETITIPLASNGTFTGGTYYIGVLSNGNRTAMVIRKNGERMGSITRNETNFDMGSMTLDVLQRPVSVNAGDTISIFAPGDESGPFGWVDKVYLIPVNARNPRSLEEYRYPAYAYGTASMYLAAADLQPGEALEIPLGDHVSFVEGQYRIAVISNGSRERFEIRVNGQPAGSILRKPSDYGDNGMSSDKLERLLYLKPSDVVTIVGQDGDFFGWVSALVLEPVE